MADYYVYDPATNKYTGPVRAKGLKLDIQDCNSFSYYKEPDGTWTADFHGAKFTVEFHGMVDLIPKTKLGIYLLLDKWDQVISEHGGTL